MVRSGGNCKMMFYFFSLLLDPLELFENLIPKNYLGILIENVLNSAIYSLS